VFFESKDREHYLSLFPGWRIHASFRHVCDSENMILPNLDIKTTGASCDNEGQL
jgi:hypothetical protein